ncbi:DUF485 domain-containing protein [Alysiella filiformis]|uniref:Uncharacterized membrane protein, DUF485 family n=1 Tax=Alysiella filiformis DSM 16848 TaxID=1120981 RepID=A0A286EJW3_9NEIS|nr:DUF485 domain-containing protein [Alysiella filiformis]QMT30700.1 DUF485 domain-containing protein [Alysiella filiformis]UBQ56320.1 DUF485 domain-containing protein [Alysiella filiformis DSM 16848]SOD71193.1 Uncharacterized membrane protein, DUF485 family [Alysiella filiformis DSM 16848]
MEHNKPDVAQERELAQRVLSHPKFKAMEKQKSILGWSFSAVMFFVYVGFIWTIGTNPQALGAKMGGGIMTVGIYAGVAMIIFAFLITLIYVWLANGKYEDMTQEVVKEVMGENK